MSDEVRAQLLANMRRDVAEETSPSKRPRVDAHERTPVAVQQLDGPLDLARELAAGVDVVRGSADPTRSATARYLVLLQGGAVPSLAEAPLSDALVDFVEVLQVMPEELEPALYRHLQTWNGASTRALSLLATLRPCRFDQVCSARHFVQTDHAATAAPLGTRAPRQGVFLAARPWQVRLFSRARAPRSNTATPDMPWSPRCRCCTSGG